ncbi:MAG: hypothetical protein ACM3VS_04715 [Candidatus Dadabacteria bacterium]
MKTECQISFLQEKIEEIGSAIFTNESEGILKLPSSIITRLKVDDYGYVWFWVQKPYKQLQEFDSGFPVRLDFFRKGVDYYIQAEGNGFVVTDPEEVLTYGQFDDSVNNDMVLVKIKLLKVDYRETKVPQRVMWWESALNTIVNFIGASQQKTRTLTVFQLSTYEQNY